jgi:hypothetical protein
MWSLSEKLGLIASHLPSGFQASSGIRQLFPAGGSRSISLLDYYVYQWDTGINPMLDPYPQRCEFVGADGAGRWFFGWNPDDAGNTAVLVDNERAQAGFVFRFSNDGKARGYVDTSRPSGLSCNSGVDEWIVNNWPDALRQGVSVDFQDATGFDSLPDESGVWTSAGFGPSDFVALQGSQCACTAWGSSEFPFFDWPISLPGGGGGPGPQAPDIYGNPPPPSTPGNPYPATDGD